MKIKLSFAIKTDIWRKDDEDIENYKEDYLQVRNTVLKRDKYTCQACGFKSKPDSKANPFSLQGSGYLEVHHLKGHRNNDLKNLVTLCPFCHSVLHIGFSGKANKGSIIYFPYITQEELNIFVNFVYSCVVFFKNDKDFGDRINLVLNVLQKHRNLAREFFGGEDKINNPYTWAIIIEKLSKEARENKNKEKVFNNFKFLPNLNSYVKAVEYWAENVWFLKLSKEAVKKNFEEMFNRYWFKPVMQVMNEENTQKRQKNRRKK